MYDLKLYVTIADRRRRLLYSPDPLQKPVIPVLSQSQFFLDFFLGWRNFLLTHWYWCDFCVSTIFQLFITLKLGNLYTLN